jgi:fumarate reductase flavoprotein subunit
MENVSRRTFVAGTAALGVAAAAAATSSAYASEKVAGSAANESPVDASDQWYFDFSTLPALSDEDEQTDVLVIGAGFGGLSSAITARDLGLNVIMVEALDDVGGTSVFTEGTYCANCQLILDANLGVDDQWKSDIVTEKLEFSHYRADRECIKALIEGGADVGDWMTSINVPFQPVESTDILGRSVEYMTSLHYDPNGSSAVEAMKTRADEIGVDTRTQTKALHLYLEDGIVKGARVEGPDGEYTIQAKATILACGGYGDSPELIAAKTGFDPERIIYTGAVGAGTGDGIRMAYECGGDQTACACPGFVWAAIKDVPIHEQASVAACNEMVFWVNQEGKRFTNEDIIYDITGCCNLILTQKHVWSILPQNEVDRLMVEPCSLGWGSYVPVGSVMSDLQSSIDTYVDMDLPNVVKADTLEELAGLMDVDPDTLVSEVEHYNEMCDAGEDSDFGKSAALMHKLETGPFYGFELYTNAPTTLGGIRINATCQVLDTEFDPIPGLYSASADNSGLSGDTYHNNPGGLTSGMALGCGRRAARAAQEYIESLA